MTRTTNRWFHAANVLVITTGCVYAWTRYFCTPSDPFAVVNHPLQPHALHLHVLSAPLLVLMIGVFWQPHAWTKFRSRSPVSRRSGLVLLVNAIPMIASGFLIQTSVLPLWRNLWIGVHLVASACWLVGSLVHWWVRRP
jgi:hypothetical protein